jgi:hypothetical protein
MNGERVTKAVFIKRGAPEEIKQEMFLALEKSVGQIIQLQRTELPGSGSLYYATMLRK